MQAILLDLDDTLLDDRNAIRWAFAAFVEAHRHCLPNVSEEGLFTSWRDTTKRHWSRYERGELSFIEQRRCRVREFLGKTLSDEEADEAFWPYQKVYELSWRLFPDAVEFLKRTKSIPKVIITNGDHEQQLRKVQTTGLVDHVVATVTSSDCGYWKPHPGIFNLAIQLLKIEPGDCLMIGDDLVRDIEPAIKLGMRCFHVQPGNPTRRLLDALAPVT
jgi:putative hydrolase of the HAD superfamily